MPFVSQWIKCIEGLYPVREPSFELRLVMDLYFEQGEN